MKMSPTDAELVTLLVRGDQIAFEAIYRKYASDLYRYARKNISTKEDCEEIVQDVFESLWVRREELSIESLRHYLLTSVRYKIIRYFKHRTVKHKYAEHFRWFELAWETVDKAEPLPENILTMINDKIAELPKRCQMAIRLRIAENLSYNEIALRMNISKKTVEMHIMKAFNHLRQSLS